MSNTPLHQVAQTTPRRDTLAFQVDLWSAVGLVPDSITDVQGRMKDIQYSSRTRLVTDTMQHTQRFRHVLRELLDRVAPEHRSDPWCKLAEDLSCSKRYNVIHLIYRNKEYEGHYKDYQFGLSTMREHWESGLQDIRASLAQPGWLEMLTTMRGSSRTIFIATRADVLRNNSRRPRQLRGSSALVIGWSAVSQ